MGDRSGSIGFWKTVGAALVAGLLLAASLFLINDAVLVNQEINGMWTCELTVTETNYPRYQGMTTGHIVVLHSDRNSVKGSAERIWEQTDGDPVKVYPPEGIIEGTIDGYHEDRLVFLRKQDRLQLMVQFYGQIRKAIYYFEAEKLSNESIDGTYVSTVGEIEKGSFECKRPKS